MTDKLVLRDQLPAPVLKFRDGGRTFVVGVAPADIALPVTEFFRGPPGPPGPIGPQGAEPDLPDLTLIFDNQLV